ncbi:MAG: hypothetical protein AM326_00680 [Candidatus Thorarchaeota archaeon SMTZ-45]|nr:MAG: hypothetical protein AM326_00680 [Candidatus Thorarchaeota archaeon SMTZ-45]
MSIRRNNLLLAAFVVMTLFLPSVAGSTRGTPTSIVSSSMVATDGPPNVATIEGMGSYVDAWGGVYNIIASMQNASHYDYAYTSALETIVTNQMNTADGYVSQMEFVFNGLTPFPNGAVGSPMAILQLAINPIWEVPADRDSASLTDLSVSEAIAIAEEVVAVYESAFGLDMDRLEIIQTNMSQWFDYYETTPVFDDGISYMMTYIDILTASQGETAMPLFLDRLANMGGFMDLVASPDWPALMTSAGEVYIPRYYLPYYDYMSSFVGNFMASSYEFYIRADASHTDLATEIQSGVVGFAGFEYPGVVDAVAGDETYSLKDHVGYIGNIQTKMDQDSSANSISAILGASPGPLSIPEIPSSWISLDDSFEIPTNISMEPYLYIEENTTLGDALKEMLSILPKGLALELNAQMLDFNTTDIESGINSAIDTLWGSLTPWPDMKQMVLSMDFSDPMFFPTTPVTELNFDLLAEIMAQAGMNPDALMSRVDDTLAAANPLAAIVEAFISYFDSYRLLDILDNDYYADPVDLEGYLNTFGDGIEGLLKDFAGIDLPTEFQSKEEIAAFLEGHWEIALGALWTAMAADNLAGIKTALINMVDMENFAKQFIPYLMADLGASWLGGIGFLGAANVDPVAMTFEPLNAADITLTFDADPDALAVDGPYLVVTKGIINRTVNVGEMVDFTITVHNYGSEAAHDILVVDGMSSGFDGERDWFWQRDTLASGATWTIDYSVQATDGGLFMDFPAFCVYFNTTLSTFDPNAAEAWPGTSRYTWSAPGYQIQVVGGGNWWEGEILGIPTLYVVAGIGGVAVIGVALLIVRRRG